MKYIYVILFFLFGIHWCYTQEDSLASVDTFYKEDQFYIGITYNLLGKKDNAFSQRGFSTGIHFGIIKDMPLNDTRNIALGIGLGYSLNSFNQNLLISKDVDNNSIYALLEANNSYTRNRFSTQLIELPLELRWRTSTPTEYKFWRIYTGFKLSYMGVNAVKYQGDLGTLKYKNFDDFNKLQYGVTLTAGYNTWNIHLYYALNPVFSNNATLNGNHIDTNVLKVGLMFYIL